MELSTTTTNSNENQHKNDTSTNNEDYDDDQPLIISCKKNKPHQEIKKKSINNGGEAFLIGEKVQVSRVVKLIPPERWGQEGLLKEWMDYSTFDALLAPKDAGSAREALVAQAARRGCRRVSSLYP